VISFDDLRVVTDPWKLIGKSDAWNILVFGLYEAFGKSLFKLVKSEKVVTWAYAKCCLEYIDFVPGAAELP